ncbi:MAG: IS701 family transposase [Chloroflexota bacterium]|nr:IS701 family transposase [Chloroflexota bacterium]
MEKLRVSPYPIAELKTFLRPYRRHFRRVESFRTLERYLSGVLSDVARKSGVGVAEAVAGLEPAGVYRLLGQTPWDESALNRQRLGMMSAEATAGDGMLLLDDTGLPRKGSKCVGVAHQYCGEWGKVTNCQVVVTASYADPYFAWPVVGRLYLPESWCDDSQRRHEAQIPDEIPFQTKPAIALELIDEAQAAGVPFATVGADSAYGSNPTFLRGLEARALPHVVAVACDWRVRLPSEIALAAQREAEAPLYRTDELVARQPADAWQTISWHQGQDGPLRKQFLALRACRVHQDETGPEGWLLAERPLPGHPGDQAYYWSNLPPDTALARLAELAHRRPCIERDYQDGKGLTGLGDYPARLWHSFDRHLVLQMVALSWLVLQQPPPEQVEIVPEPPPVAPADEPSFPLRLAPLSESVSCS